MQIALTLYGNSFSLRGPECVIIAEVNTKKAVTTKRKDYTPIPRIRHE